MNVAFWIAVLGCIYFWGKALMAIFGLVCAYNMKDLWKEKQAIRAAGGWLAVYPWTNLFIAIGSVILAIGLH